MEDQPLQGLTICYFGHYDPDYPRNRVLRSALRRVGASIIDINDRSRGLSRSLKLFRKAIRRDFHVMVVPPFSHTDMATARLVCSLKRVPLIFDPLVSLYEGLLDRRCDHPKSLAAKKAYWIDKIGFKIADIVLSDGETTTLRFVEQFGLRKARFRRLWTGADDDILKPALPVEESSPFVVFFTGSFIPLHGIEYIIKAAKILQDWEENVRFVLVGAGQTFAENVALMTTLGISNLEFRGPVPFDKYSELMSQAHLCLGTFGTSDKAQHGIPNKVFCALATNRAVVTGDTPAIREVFTHGENIWLCPMGNAPALAASIIELKQRPDLRANIAQKGYELFVREFSINAIKTDVVEILEGLYQTQPSYGWSRGM